MENQELRWKQRFVNFEKSFHLLERTVDITPLSEAEKGGLIQFYEICFELAWKTMKDYLTGEGFSVKSPRQAIKLAFQIELITEGELWLEALDDRNMTVHVYDETAIDQIADRIKNSYFDSLQSLYLSLRDKL